MLQRWRHAALNSKQRPLRPNRKEVTTHSLLRWRSRCGLIVCRGLDERQLDELEERVSRTPRKAVGSKTLAARGNSPSGKRSSLPAATCGRIRLEDVWADIFDVDQSTISRIITSLTPLVEQATEELRPTPEEAAEATRGAIALVDGTLWPCWSWDGESKLWSEQIQDHRTRLSDCHGYPRPHNVRSSPLPAIGTTWRN